MSTATAEAQLTEDQAHKQLLVQGMITLAERQKDAAAQLAEATPTSEITIAVPLDDDLKQVFNLSGVEWKTLAVMVQLLRVMTLKEEPPAGMWALPTPVAIEPHTETE